MNAVDCYLAELVDRRGQRGSFIPVDPDWVPGCWTTSVMRPDVPIGPRTTGPLVHKPLTVLNTAGRVQLARVTEETSHRRTWGAHLIRTWLEPWLEHKRMHDYSLEYPGSSIWYRKLPPEHPTVSTWIDRAAQLLWSAKMNHADALDQLDDFDKSDWRVRRSLILSPLRYKDALAQWICISERD